MLPELINDDEFKDHLSLYKQSMDDGFTDMKAATESMAILCDNAYRRISDDTCTAAVKLKLEASGNLTRISQTQLDAGAFAPKTVLAGEFTIFSYHAAAPILTPVAAVSHADFCGRYVLNSSRILSPHELSLIPSLEPWYILPGQIINVCKHALQSTGKSSQMRNFLLRGPAGTGTTEGAKAIAAGMALPYVKYTCSANTEIYDFIGQVFPETGLASTGDAELDREREKLAAMGGITYENVSKLLELPGLDDMEYDPAGVFSALAGRENANASVQECMALVMAQITDKIQNLCIIKSEGHDSGQTYIYTETDFVRALKYGWVCEIQEPSTIMQPGVLVGLNSLLEQTGSVTLPTGEVIRRHPDTVVVITTNIDYEGCRGMNQSVLDRMNMVLDIDLPPAEIMAQRAMSVTGCEDDYMVSQMVQTVTDMADFCRKNGITDGSCGMRGLIDWIISTDITGDAHESALHTIISKATANDEDRQTLITSVLEPLFAPNRRMKSA
jgi:MoxR-like ATPase